ncbi:MAG: hypothetical protein WA364_19745 [Candidatus Nitrosopolaris sp.]
MEDVDDRDKDGDVLGKVNQALNKSGLPQGKSWKKMLSSRNKLDKFEPWR